MTICTVGWELSHLDVVDEDTGADADIAVLLGLVFP